MKHFTINVTYDSYMHVWRVGRPETPAVQVNGLTLTGALEQFAGLMTDAGIDKPGGIDFPEEPNYQGANLGAELVLTEWFRTHLPGAIQDGESALQTAIRLLSAWQSERYDMRLLLLTLAKDLDSGALPDFIGTPSLLGIVIAKLLLKLRRDGDKDAAK